ncbi:DUF1800 domain-containing protein [Marinirhabdus gelatinilytica]|uniref:Uncharacterized protein (DUF1800 family) n=1 Tax=Marinirhabdus gelatinilytica TaxID=1703343 RepID=A0A370QJY4_9FLAO|nr:DUF1800 family protein [Marinirhabdus gelatinilytica]RDK88370.1 uncharacterized protein (DUF1800 family) [Marinirhabdus gelatinilytica]
METLLNPSCNTATLAPYTPTGQNPWDVSKIKHAYRRLGFGATILEIDDALGLTPGQFIDNIVDTAEALPPTPAPFWANYAISSFGDFETENEQYIFNWRIQTGNDIIAEQLRGRLAFFWMNHFVTEIESVFYAPFMYQYYNKMQTFALGNFREFTRTMGLDNMMLLYLNGFENTNNNPNENYARELFELFTLGEGNGYTQQDIVEASRALTGYNHWLEPGADIYFDASTFDDGQKTIFGQMGNWDYNDVIDILFQEKETLIAAYICEKLYTFFVSPTVDALIRQDIIAPLAQTLINADFEMVPMLKQLFKSEHFFDERALGVVIKSPIDTIYNFTTEGSFFYDDTLIEAFLYYAGLMGQEVYDPPDVSGWQRDETWINASTLTGRWQLIELYIDYLFGNGYDTTLVDLARELSNDSNDPAYITEVVINHFVAKELHTTTDYDVATDIFKWEVPQNYYDTGQWNLNWTSAAFQVSLLLKHIARMPEFQLK